MLLKTLLVSICIIHSFGHPLEKDDVQVDDDVMHPDIHFYAQPQYDPEEENATHWNDKAQATLKEHIDKKVIKGHAKNVILFLGDGMSIPTLAATRAYLGQKNGKPGEETRLSFEEFPYTGLSKTYCVDSQVADSACSATAYLTGVKANIKTIGVTAAVKLTDCKAMNEEKNHVSSIGKWFQDNGRRSGIVTTTRVTHASPTGVYGHIAHRDWESDSVVKNFNQSFEECRDIAYQLIHKEPGKSLNVIFGGGRRNFVPHNETDDEGIFGNRTGNENLINTWSNNKKNSTHRYVFNKKGLVDIPDDTTYSLGLFSTTHLPYNLDRNVEEKPSLEEMTEKAIRLLAHNNDKGFFLFVEGGRIDHGHHETKAHQALEETVEFHKAVKKAVELTERNDTLIVITSDHAHTMSVSGYPARGNKIFEFAGRAADDLPYSTLSYANGAGYKKEVDGNRHNLTGDDLDNKDRLFPSMVPKVDETHGGDDVGIFALGPWAHLFTGVVEQNVIPHLMAYASCVGEGKKACD